jgi:hypothetical protein
LPNDENTKQYHPNTTLPGVSLASSLLKLLEPFIEFFFPPPPPAFSAHNGYAHVVHGLRNRIENLIE